MTETVELRNYLREVEAEIKNLVGKDQMDFHLRNRRHTPVFDKVSNLISARSTILDKMFTATVDEVKRFEEVNALLKKLTEQMYRRTTSIYRCMLSCRDELFDNIYSYDTVGTLRHDAEYDPDKDTGDVLRLDNDEYYGSDFTYMIPLAWLLEEGFRGEGRDIQSCWAVYDKRHTPTSSDEELGCSDWFDTGFSWAEGQWLQNPKLEHVCICHAVHSICTHYSFSIPDLLRMNHFQVEVKNTCMQDLYQHTRLDFKSM